MTAEIVFAAAAVLVAGGAVGVVASRNPVHAALFLMQTLLGVALLFLLQGAHFLAAVQLIVYAGAVVILFLFVIMLLGVDRAEDLRVEPIRGQRLLAAGLGTAFAAMLITVAVVSGGALPGTRRADGVRALDNGVADVERLGRLLFSEHAFAVEIAAALLTIAVVAAVALTRSASRSHGGTARSADRSQAAAEAVPPAPGARRAVGTTPPASR